MFEETLSVDAVLAGSVDPSVKGHWPPHLDRELPECKTALTSRYWLRTGDSWHFRMTSCDIHSCVSGSVWLTQSFAAAICLRFRCGSACVCARAHVCLCGNAMSALCESACRSACLWFTTGHKHLHSAGILHCHRWCCFCILLFHCIASICFLLFCSFSNRFHLLHFLHNEPLL